MRRWGRRRFGLESSVRRHHRPRSHAGRAALHWALERDDAETALRLTAALSWSWIVHFRWAEARVFLERVLALPGSQARTAARATALVRAATIGSVLGDLVTARAYIDDCLSICVEIGEEKVALDARGTGTLVRAFQGEFRAAYAHVDQKGIQGAINLNNDDANMYSVEYVYNVSKYSNHN